MGYTCSADFHLSNKTIGDGHYQPYCVWIDHDHSNGLRHQGLSLHLPDFTTSQQGQSAEYSASLDPLCKSDPRMKFWPTIVPDAIIPFFKPPLQYNADGSDVDPKLVVNKSKRRSIQTPPPKGGRQLHPDHLIVTSFDRHSAKELCETDASIGPDVVSMKEGIFCDMATKEQWPVCSPKLSTACFDVNQGKMRGNAPAASGKQPTVHTDAATGRAIPVKAYKTTHHWG